MASSSASMPPQTVDEWALSLPEEDRKRLTAILVYTPFARHFLEQAWKAGYHQAVKAHDASGCPGIFMAKDRDW